MLDWVFDGIVTWISSIVTSIMDTISNLFLGALGTDMTAMEEYFPFITKAFSIMQYTAWAMLFLITVWQLFRVFGGPVTEAENPWALLARAVIFAILIGYAKPIFLLALQIARAPYTALMDLTMSAEDFTFAGVEQVLTNGLVTILGALSIVGSILLIILMIALGWNYFKLLLETVERYVVVGVLCYTSPLAFCMGASKATNNVFRSWCRMVGSQLLLLTMNVWFLRAFNSSVGQFVGNGGALSNGMGSIFLWLFCALAFLKTAQKFDSYLASMGLNVAQTGSSMGMELLMAARVVSGFGSGVRNAGSMFKGTGTAGSTASSAGGAASGGFLSSFANKFRGNSYVRDAVVSGGTRMGANGAAGFVGRAFGGVAARNGAVLDSHSISSVAAKTPANSGNLGGEIADRSLGSYMPQLQGRKLADTQISGGRISTNVVGSDGKVTAVEMYAADQFDKPDVPHTVVTAADGSQWYQMVSGPEAGSFYETPTFTGSPAEAAQVAESFPDAPEGTTLRTVDDGVIEATNDQGSSLWYNSAFYDEPDAPHSTIQAANGVEWYAMDPKAATPDFVSGETPTFTGNPAEAAQVTEAFPDAPEGTTLRTVGDGVIEATTENGSAMWYNSAYFNEPEGPHDTVQAADGTEWYSIPQQVPGSDTIPSFTGGTAEAADVSAYFPDAPQGATLRTVGDGVVEATTEKGSSMWYSSAYYNEPSAPHETMQAADGSSWYAMPSQPFGADAIPTFTGSAGEAAQISSYFPDAPQGTALRTVGDGVVEATTEQGSSMWYSSAYYNEPSAAHEVMRAANGVDWYAVQQGAEGYTAAPPFRSDTMPAFTGSPAETAQVRSYFPDAPQGTTLRSVGNGAVEATTEQGSAKWYSSAYYNEPAAPHEVMHSASGIDWYAMQPNAAGPEYTPTPRADAPAYGSEAPSRRVEASPYGSEAPTRRTDAPYGDAGVNFYGAQTGQPTPRYSGGYEPYTPTRRDGYSAADAGERAHAYNRAQFQSFMPGYENRVTSVDGTHRSEGRIEVRHANGSGTMFYDTTMYAPPRGNYKVYEDKNGSQWYAVSGQATVERRPVYDSGKPVYDGDKLRTRTVESMRYQSMPTRYTSPTKRQPKIKAPKRKR